MISHNNYFSNTIIGLKNRQRETIFKPKTSEVYFKTGLPNSTLRNLLRITCEVQEAPFPSMFDTYWETFHPFKLGTLCLR